MAPTAAPKVGFCAADSEICPQPAVLSHAAVASRANDRASNEILSPSYATLVPMATLVKVILAQRLLLLLWRGCLIHIMFMFWTK
jgi:hypothetical protein